ncbi:hypothetical protein [Thiobacillus sp.]
MDEHAMGRQAIDESGISQAGGNQHEGDQGKHQGQVIYPVKREEKRIAGNTADGQAESSQCRDRGQEQYGPPFALVEHQQPG